MAIMPTLRPGEGSTFATDLARGRYAIISFAKGPDGVLDALKGMNREIRVRRR